MQSHRMDTCQQVMSPFCTIQCVRASSRQSRWISLDLGLSRAPCSELEDRFDKRITRSRDFVGMMRMHLFVRDSRVPRRCSYLQWSQLPEGRPASSQSFSIEERRRGFGSEKLHSAMPPATRGLALLGPMPTGPAGCCDSRSVGTKFEV